MEDVRSVLTAYVTEGEPPIGLSGEEVLSAARLSRRRYLLTGAAALAVVVLALTLAVVVLPHRGQVAGAPCPTASDTRAALVDRLSCVVGRAVRALLSPDAQITRLTIPGETPPDDPFHLIADPAGDSPRPRDALFHMGVRVTDAQGTGSVYILIVPSANSGGPPCEEPEEIVCRTEPTPQGLLWLSTLRSGDVLTHRVALAAPDAVVQFWSNNSGVLQQMGVRLPKQRPEPTLTLDQVRQLALTPGLGF
ncbi:hypothetical protein DMA12_36885 [Amycolatopsis balhimycina DSM 5908]|uniref:Uncharacterized protein n=1 Tax=Amycolatopsis balhimycina DSM 5908 TaxID=1081091 RepID=A0A428W2Y9_AMYBA|nr:hypothetical protein [Amycolatopsis balhimycina]RSM37403.1 hypothetical protein DMA12_36885 [Amycolatopsis balhimycina DSM 5908]